MGAGDGASGKPPPGTTASGLPARYSEAAGSRRMT